MFSSNRTSLAVAALAVFVTVSVCGLAAPAAAQTAPKARTAQQERMVECNQQAKGKMGDDRKVFMKTCLKGEAASGKTLSASQERMKSCNADATSKSLKGDERKAFMKTCLKAG